MYSTWTSAESKPVSSYTCTYMYAHKILSKRFIFNKTFSSMEDPFAKDDYRND